MTRYGRKMKINGLWCYSVLRGMANGQYTVYFEKEAATLEQLESIDWLHPEIEDFSGDQVLPKHCGFVVTEISYRAGSWAVALTISERYMGDVEGYELQIKEMKVQNEMWSQAVQQKDVELQKAAQEKETALAEKDAVIEEKEREIASSTANITVLRANTAAIAKISTEIPDELALSIAQAAPASFPAWETVLEEGKELAQGRIIDKEGQLYRVEQAVTPQAHQVPGGDGMLAVYRPIEISHQGTKDDPIPWVYGMDCRTGKYYSYEDSLWLCKGDMIPCVWTPGSPGMWQWEKVDEAV